VINNVKTTLIKKVNIFMLILALFLINSCEFYKVKRFGLSYGAFISNDGIKFKIHAPSSDFVYLVIFDEIKDKQGSEYLMGKVENGDWEYFLPNATDGTLYGYRLEGPQNDKNVIIADPYSKATVTQNSWRHIAKTIAINGKFNWEGDSWIKKDQKDLIIYEAHLRDLTQHKTSLAKSRGSYLGLIEKNQNGGIKHLKDLGINAIQFLPLWDYANFEIPFKKEVEGFYNDWNPYERNHWGYMPTFFTAPESYYASDWTDIPGKWNGIDGKAVFEMKTMVKSLHKEGISVILDVVINHVSNYDYHPLKYIDKSLYFKLDSNNNYVSQCCGNLLNTDNDKVRQYIIESLKYWMTDYHIDGFRFDQCHLLSKETAIIIKNELQSINPNVIIYGEAWDEREKEFSNIDWGSFNAKFRDVLRGDLNNINEKGFLFGQYRQGESMEDICSIIMGSSFGAKSIYKSPSHSINFLEVHDNYSFSDYLKLSLGVISKDDTFEEPFLPLNKESILSKINKLAALILLTSQGIPLIHQGQEWAHSQVISATKNPDLNIGKIDGNPYNKDNQTNWVNWDNKNINKDLVDYYINLIKIRKSIPIFRHANQKDFKFQGLSEYAIGYTINENIAVYINSAPLTEVSTYLPKGNWTILADGDSADIDGLRITSGQMKIPPSSGLILKKNN
jgi:pullulanase